MSLCQHLNVEDMEDEYVCADCQQEVRPYSPWEDPKNWGGMHLDDFRAAPQWVVQDRRTQ